MDHYTSQQSPENLANLEDSYEEYETNRTQKPLSFLPSIKMSSKQAHRLLFDPRELNEAAQNRSLIDYTNNEPISGNLPYRKRLNMSLLIPNGTKRTSAIPGKHDFILNNAKDYEINTGRTDYQPQTRRSVGASKSVASDRLIDYQNHKNARMQNMSVTEQFNLDILNNLGSWGEKVSASVQKPKTSKYANQMNKHSPNNNFMLTKRRVLNHKRKDFWNLKLNDRTSLPPPPMGKSYGHGILTQKIAKAQPIEDTLDVTEISTRF